MKEAEVVVFIAVNAGGEQPDVRLLYAFIVLAPLIMSRLFEEDR
jgi:hypothetical protein